MAEEIVDTNHKHNNLESRRRRTWFARYSLTMIIVLTFLGLVGLLFFATLPDEAPDIHKILLGANVEVLAKTTEYRFKEKDDPEINEAQALHEQDIINGK